MYDIKKKLFPLNRDPVYSTRLQSIFHIEHSSHGKKLEINPPYIVFQSSAFVLYNEKSEAFIASRGGSNIMGPFNLNVLVVQKKKGHLAQLV